MALPPSPGPSPTDAVSSSQSEKTASEPNPQRVLQGAVPDDVEMIDASECDGDELLNIVMWVLFAAVFCKLYVFDVAQITLSYSLQVRVLLGNFLYLIKKSPSWRHRNVFAAVSELCNSCNISLSLLARSANSSVDSLAKVGVCLQLLTARDPLLWDSDAGDLVSKYNKYHADYVRRIEAKYFSRKACNGGSIFDEETKIENEVIKSSRWHCTKSFIDPVQSCEDQGGSSPSVAEASSNTSNRKILSKKSS